MGLLDFLSPALNVATGAAGTYENAQAQGAQQKQQQVIQSLMLQRQQKEQALKDALTQSQTKEADARTGDIQSQGQLRQYQLGHPKPEAPIMGSPEWIEAKRQEAIIGNQYGYHPPAPQDKYQFVQGTDEQGNPIIYSGSTQNGTLTSTGQHGRPLPAKNSALQQRVQLHYQPALDADALLDKYGNALPAGAGHGTVTNFLTGAVDPDMQQATQAANEFVTHVGPLVNNGRMTQVDLNQIRHTYIPEVGDRPQLVQQKSQRRKALLQSLHAETSPNGGGSGTPPISTTGSQTQQLWDAAVQKYGQAKVLQEYGPRPTE